MHLIAAIFALTVIAGDWKVDQGALRGEAPQGDKKRAVAMALVGPEHGDPLEAIEATLAVDPVKGRPANGFIIFDLERDSAGRPIAGRFAGLYIGAKRATIGTFGRGQGLQKIEDASCDVRGGTTYKLKLALDGERAVLSVDGAEVVSCALEGGRSGSGQGFLTLGVARFGEMTGRAKGAVVFEERFDDKTDGEVAGRATAAPPAMPGMGDDGGAMKPDAGAMMKPAAGGSKGGQMAPTTAPAATTLEGGGYAGGPLGKTPGLDGPLPAESFAVPVERRHLIRRRYLDLLGRGPTEAEILVAAKATDDQYVDALLRSGEFWRNWYEDELFYFLLIDQFRPTGEPLASMPDRLARGEADAHAALAEIVISQYFSARNPGNDTFVTVVMEECLGLKVQDKANVKDLEGGKKMYDGYPATYLGEKGASQSDVVKITFGKRAFSERYVERLYKRVIGAEMPPEERKAAGERFEKEPKALAEIVRGWLLSPLYVSNAKYPRVKSDAQWVRTLYADLLGSRPDYKEFRDTRNALLALADSTPIRRVLGKVVVDSKKADRAAAAGSDPKRWIEERFLLLLGRAPTPKELETFQAVLKDSGPRIILKTLIQSKEYQSY